MLSSRLSLNFFNLVKMWQKCFYRLLTVNSLQEIDISDLSILMEKKILLWEKEKMLVTSISPFPTMFSKAFFVTKYLTQNCIVEC